MSQPSRFRRATSGVAGQLGQHSLVPPQLEWKHTTLDPSVGLMCFPPPGAAYFLASGMLDFAPLLLEARAFALAADADGTGFRLPRPVVSVAGARSPLPGELAGATVGPPVSDVTSILATELDERLWWDDDELRFREDARSGLDPPVAPDVPSPPPAFPDLLVIWTESEAAPMLWKRS